MTALNTKQRYHLRLIERHAFFDINGSHLWREWAEGTIVTDPDEIRLLEQRGAAAERVDVPFPQPEPRS